MNPHLLLLSIFLLAVIDVLLFAFIPGAYRQRRYLTPLVGGWMALWDWLRK